MHVEKSTLKASGLETDSSGTEIQIINSYNIGIVEWIKQVITSSQTQSLS
jgi:hypothetical protein